MIKIIKGIVSHQINGLGLNILAQTYPNTLKAVEQYPAKNLMIFYYFYSYQSLHQTSNGADIKSHQNSNAPGISLCHIPMIKYNGNNKHHAKNITIYQMQNKIKNIAINGNVIILPIKYQFIIFLPIKDIRSDIIMHLYYI